MLSTRVLGFGVLKQNGGDIRYLKGDTECRNNHRDDGIEEPLGTVEHLTQYDGMYSSISAVQIRSSFAACYLLSVYIAAKSSHINKTL